MKQKHLVMLMIAINLTVGNFILIKYELSRLVSSFIAGNETLVPQAVLHLLCSIIAVSSILGIVRLIRAKDRMTITIVLCSLLGALSVPFLSTYILFFGYALVRLRFDMFGPALFVAISSTIQSVQFWLPFALVNCGFLVVYNQRTRDSSANQAL